MKKKTNVVIKDPITISKLGAMEHEVIDEGFSLDKKKNPVGTILLIIIILAIIGFLIWYFVLNK